MNWDAPKLYALKHKNEEVRMASRSGGIFTALSDYVLENQGVIYGCVLNEHFEAVHIRAKTAEERNRMRGSKYVQSNIGDAYRQVKKDLKDGKMVMFTGTSCQIAGLQGFLRTEYSNLLLVDIVCHGVPSPLLLKKYIDWQSQKKGKDIVFFDFRNKKDFGWDHNVETLYFSDQSKLDSYVYTQMFYKHIFLRSSCFKCPYKQILHPGDITIADYWGIDKAAPGFNDNKGVSLVMVNNDKGMEYFEKVRDAVDCCETKIEDSMQHPFVGPFPAPQNRTEGLQDLATLSFDKIAVKYGGYGMMNKIKRGIKKVFPFCSK